MFSTLSKREIGIFLLSANVSNLVMVQILSFGKGLKEKDVVSVD